MFTDFKKAFLNDERNTKIPPTLLDALSDQLPEGFRYVQVSKEAVGIVPITKQINITVPLPLHDKLDSPKKLLEYLYRTQEEIEIPSDYIFINGHKFTPDQFISFPLKNTSVSNDDFKLVLKPAPFPDPFPIQVAYGEIRKTFYMQRKPFPEMTKSKFKSIDDGALEMVYIIDEEKSEIQITLNIDVARAINVNDVIESFEMYKGFTEGKITIFNQRINALPDTQSIDSIDEIIKFWKKVKAVEEKLNVKFNPNTNVTIDDVSWIEKLYKSFVENKPYKEYVKLDNIIIDKDSTINQDELLNKQGLSLQFIQSANIELFGVVLPLINFVTWFDLRIYNIVEKSDLKYELLIEPIKKDISQVVKHFMTMEQAEDYQRHFQQNVSELANAELIDLGFNRS